MIIESPIVTIAASNPRPGSNGQVTTPKILVDYPALTSCVRNVNGDYTIEGPQATLDSIAVDPVYTVVTP